MDPLTHGLLGASLGQALSGPALGRRALPWGAVLGMAPDVDILLGTSNPFAEWRWHRGATHGLAVELAAGCLLGWLLARRSGGALKSWLALAIAALVSHPLLDWCTTYGTQLLAPFSSRRRADWWDRRSRLQPDLAAGPWRAVRGSHDTRGPARRRRCCRCALYLALGGSERPHRSDRPATTSALRVRPSPACRRIRRCSSFRSGGSWRGAATRCAWLAQPLRPRPTGRASRRLKACP
jgi:hypothetical protein